MTVLITLTTAGTDSGPFDLYSDLDGYLSAFESGVDKVDLELGYASFLVPDYTNIIRVKSNGVYCTNYINIPVGTTTTTTSSTTTTTTTVAPIPLDFYVYKICAGVDLAYVGLDDITGGVGPYYVATTTFADETSALANTSWNLTSNPGDVAVNYAETIAGTYWLSIIDSDGTIFAKEIYADCM